MILPEETHCWEPRVIHRGAPFSGSAQTGARSKIIQLSEIFPNRAGLSIF